MNLARVLVQLGIDVQREANGELWASCPGHRQRVGREDSKPSWSISEDSNSHHCFSCGYSGNLVSLVADIREYTTGQALVWLLKDGYRPQPPPPQQRPQFQRSSFRLTDVGVPPDEALAQRNLERFAVVHYGVGWEPDSGTWLLPLQDSTGALMGYQAKRGPRVRNLPAGILKKNFLFGFPQLLTAPAGAAVLVESPLDVVRLYSAGFPRAVASLGAYVSAAQMEMLHRQGDGLIMALDNDAVGLEQMKRLKYFYATSFSMSFFEYGNSRAKDPGEMSDEEIAAGIAGATLWPRWHAEQPTWAVGRFVEPRYAVGKGGREWTRTRAASSRTS